jgi:hypothetical protein
MDKETADLEPLRAPDVDWIQIKFLCEIEQATRVLCERLERDFKKWKALPFSLKLPVEISRDRRSLTLHVSDPSWTDVGSIVIVPEQHQISVRFERFKQPDVPHKIIVRPTMTDQGEFRFTKTVIKSAGQKEPDGPPVQLELWEASKTILEPLLFPPRYEYQEA